MPGLLSICIIAGEGRCSPAYLNYIYFHFVNETSPKFRREPVGYPDYWFTCTKKQVEHKSNRDDLSLQGCQLYYQSSLLKHSTRHGAECRKDPSPSSHYRLKHEGENKDRCLLPLILEQPSSLAQRSPFHFHCHADKAALSWPVFWKGSFKLGVWRALTS